MKWHRTERRWADVKAALRSEFPKLREEDYQRISGKKEELLELLQRRYGLELEAAERELARFAESLEADVDSAPRLGSSPSEAHRLAPDDDGANPGEEARTPPREGHSRDVTREGYVHVNTSMTGVDVNHRGRGDTAGQWHHGRPATDFDGDTRATTTTGVTTDNVNERNLPQARQLHRSGESSDASSRGAAGGPGVLDTTNPPDATDRGAASEVPPAERLTSSRPHLVITDVSESDGIVEVEVGEAPKRPSSKKGR